MYVIKDEIRNHPSYLPFSKEKNEKEMKKKKANRERMERLDGGGSVCLFFCRVLVVDLRTIITYLFVDT